MDGKVCFHCGDEIVSGMRYQLIGLDKPYTNLIMHKDCYKSIPDLVVYLDDNEDKISTYVEKFSKKKEKQVKTTTKERSVLLLVNNEK